MFLAISHSIIVRFSKFKNWHTQENEPVVRKIMAVVRTACLSSQVTTWRQKRNTETEVITTGQQSRDQTCDVINAGAVASENSWLLNVTSWACFKLNPKLIRGPFGWNITQPFKTKPVTSQTHFTDWNVGPWEQRCASFEVVTIPLEISQSKQSLKSRHPVICCSFQQTCDPSKSATLLRLCMTSQAHLFWLGHFLGKIEAVKWAQVC